MLNLMKYCHSSQLLHRTGDVIIILKEKGNKCRPLIIITGHSIYE